MTWFSNIIKVCYAVITFHDVQCRDMARWAVRKGQEKKLDVAEMRMLRWMSGVTKLDRIRNERSKRTTKVDKISKKCRKV